MAGEGRGVQCKCWVIHWLKFERTSNIHHSHVNSFFLLTFLKTSMLTSRQKLGFLDLTLKAFGRLYRTIRLHRQSFHLSLKLNKLSSISMMIGSFHSFQNRFSFWFQLVICPSQDCFYLRMIDSCYLVGLFVQNGSLSRLRGVYVNIWPIHPFH